MSTSRNESSAAIVRVKGVSFNYLTFLWKQLDRISEARQQGNNPVALSLCVGMIPWLPRSLKKEFLTRAMLINKDLLTIRSNNLPQLKKIVDLHQRTAARNKLLVMYSSTALTCFINDLTTKLDQMGYMENTKDVTEGDTEQTGEGNWADDQYYEKAKDKGKKRKSKENKPPTPEGDVMSM